jgi:hypothetical protein
VGRGTIIIIIIIIKEVESRGKREAESMRLGRRER